MLHVTAVGQGPVHSEMLASKSARLSTDNFGLALAPGSVKNEFRPGFAGFLTDRSFISRTHRSRTTAFSSCFALVRLWPRDNECGFPARLEPCKPLELATISVREPETGASI